MEPLLYSKADSDISIAGWVALDTETEMIQLQRGAGAERGPAGTTTIKTHISPPDVPYLILGSVARDGRVDVYHREALLDQFADLLRGTSHIVFHNCAFDIPVMAKARPSLWPLIVAAVEAGRIHDTMLLEGLLRLAEGRATVNAKMQMFRQFTLKDLTFKYCGDTLDKNKDIRLNFAQFKDPESTIPEEFLAYASADAAYTYRIYQTQRRIAENLADSCNSRYPVLPGAREKFGLLSEKVQVMGALAFQWLEQFPIRVDLAAAKKLRQEYADELTELESILISYDWASRDKKLRFKVKQKALRKNLELWASANGIEVERTTTNQVSLRHDFWASQGLRRFTRADIASARAFTTIDERLGVWLRFSHLQKWLNTFVNVYSLSERHYPSYLHFGARTGRTSCQRPNIQQVPRDKTIRNLFIPEDGNVLIECDLAAAELVALAQVYRLMYGGSHLGSDINASRDPHKSIVAKIFNLDFDKLPSVEAKEKRQLGKAVNFGLPGGLGIRTFIRTVRKMWGIVLSEDEAKQLRDRVLAVDPALSCYLDSSRSPENYVAHAAALLCTTEAALADATRSWRDRDDNVINYRKLARDLRRWSRGNNTYDIASPPGFDRRFGLEYETTRLLTGLIRANVNYSQSRNSPFQGPIAAAGKIGLWNLFRYWLHEPFFQPVAFIHDSIILQTADYDRASSILRESMVCALRTIAPDILCSAEVSPAMSAWKRVLTISS